MQTFLIFLLVFIVLILLSAFVYSKYDIKGYLTLVLVEILLVFFVLTFFPSVLGAKLELDIRDHYWEVVPFFTFGYGAMASLSNTIGLAVVVLFREWRLKSDQSKRQKSVEDCID